MYIYEVNRIYEDSQKSGVPRLLFGSRLYNTIECLSQREPERAKQLYEGLRNLLDWYEENKREG